MDVVKFETAKKLKAAGLLQPNVTRDTCLYKEDGTLLYVVKVIHNLRDRKSLCLYVDSGELVEERIKLEDCFFAPDTQHLLSKMRGVYVFLSPGAGFDCVDSTTGKTRGFDGKSCAEACGTAYLWFLK